MKCEYCGTELKLRKTLLLHQKQAQYCLKIQKEQVDRVTCNFCHKRCEDIESREEHQKTCESRMLNMMLELASLRKETEMLRKENSELKKRLTAATTINRSNGSHRNNKVNNIENKNNININIYSHLPPLDLSHERIQKVFESYTTDDFNKGVPGVADIINKKVLCNESGEKCFVWENKTDRIMVYNDKHQNVIRDPNCDNLKERVLPLLKPRIRSHKATLMYGCLPGSENRISKRSKELINLEDFSKHLVDRDGMSG